MAVDELAKKMKGEWDRRIAHDYRYWMSDGVESDEKMWATGERDLNSLLAELSSVDLSKLIALDIGCGVGRLARAAGSRFKLVIGVDVSSEGITRARSLSAEKRNMEVRLGSGVGLADISSASVDCLYSLAAIVRMQI